MKVLGVVGVILVSGAILRCNPPEKQSNWFTPWHERLCSVADDVHSLPFAGSAWKDGTPVVRGQMVTSLVCSGRLIEMDRKQVLSELGPPDEVREGVLVYRIHHEKGFVAHEPPRPQHIQCEAGEWELTFDFSIKVPDDGFYTHDLSRKCWRVDS